MKLVPNWTKAWKWFSVQAIAFAALWETIPLEAKAVLEAGVMLNGEEKPTLPAAVEMLAPTQLLLTICEGKYHQVKRMVAAVGNKVVALHRQQVGSVILDPTLGEGEWRYLSADEVAALAR